MDFRVVLWLIGQYMMRQPAIRIEPSAFSISWWLLTRVRLPIFSTERFKQCKYLMSSGQIQVLLGLVILMLGRIPTVSSDERFPKHFQDGLEHRLSCGTAIVTSSFTARTLLVFGLIGSLPLFVFNHYFGEAFS
jgi:hypothetical protein